MSNRTGAREIWRPIPNTEGYYEASDLGHVRSVDRVIAARNGTLIHRRGQPLKGCLNRAGRLVVTISCPAYKRTRLVHQLVLEAFVGLRPLPALEGCHRNGDCLDNRIVNLRWDTASSNARDKVRHGTDSHTRRTHCPRRHLLQAPNLIAWRLAIGHRGCLACSRAMSVQQKARKAGRKVDFVAIADWYYAKIMGLAA